MGASQPKLTINTDDTIRLLKENQYSFLSIIGQGNTAIAFKTEKQNSTYVGKLFDLNYYRNLTKNTDALNILARNISQYKSLVNINNIAQYKDYIQDNNTPILVMEYLPVKCNIFELVSSKKNTDNFTVIINLISQIINCISNLHSIQIRHLNIKSTKIYCVDQNSLQIKFSEIRLLPFPTPKSSDDIYISPQQRSGAKCDDSLTDIWQIGVLSLEIIIQRKLTKTDINNRNKLHVNLDAPKKELYTLVSSCFNEDFERPRIDQLKREFDIIVDKYFLQNEIPQDHVFPYDNSEKITTNEKYLTESNNDAHAADKSLTKSSEQYDVQHISGHTPDIDNYGTTGNQEPYNDKYDNQDTYINKENSYFRRVDMENTLVSDDYGSVDSVKWRNQNGECSEEEITKLMGELRDKMANKKKLVSEFNESNKKINILRSKLRKSSQIQSELALKNKNLKEQIRRADAQSTTNEKRSILNIYETIQTDINHQLHELENEKLLLIDRYSLLSELINSMTGDSIDATPLVPKVKRAINPDPNDYSKVKLKIDRKFDKVQHLLTEEEDYSQIYNAFVQCCSYSNQNYEQLDLSENNLNEKPGELYKELTNMITYLDYLIDVDLSGCYLGKNIIIISMSFRKLPQLQKLNLTRNFMFNNDVYNLLINLRYNTILDTLILDRNKLSDPNLFTFDLWQNLVSLNTLSLVENDFPIGENIPFPVNTQNSCSVIYTPRK